LTIIVSAVFLYVVANAHGLVIIFGLLRKREFAFHFSALGCESDFSVPASSAFVALGSAELEILHDVTGDDGDDDDGALESIVIVLPKLAFSAGFLASACLSPIRSCVVEILCAIPRIPLALQAFQPTQPRHK
jgi:hypothetical protein